MLTLNMVEADDIAYSEVARYLVQNADEAFQKRDEARCEMLISELYRWFDRHEIKAVFGTLVAITDMMCS